MSDIYIDIIDNRFIHLHVIIMFADTSLSNELSLFSGNYLFFFLQFLNYKWALHLHLKAHQKMIKNFDSAFSDCLVCEDFHVDLQTAFPFQFK